MLLASARKIAVRSMDNYSHDGHRLYRKLYDHDREEWIERVVIPAGGLKSLWDNGRKRPLTLRRKLLLEFHDEEASGAHLNATDTAAKLASFAGGLHWSMTPSDG